MKKLVLVVLLLAGLAYLAWRSGTVQDELVAAAIPAFPELPGPASSLAEDAAGEIYFSSLTPYDFDVLINDPSLATDSTGFGTLFLPDHASAQSPVPAMVVLHGSGGISPGREMEYGQLLADHGFAALVVNYYLPRGVTEETPYMVRVIAVTEFDAVADAYGALRLLSTHPAIDADRIGVMGFSYGGMATRFAMDERLRKQLAPELPGFSAYVDYYGPCFQKLGTTETNGSPLLTLRGTEDASNNLEDCRRREQEMRELGVEVVAQVYEGPDTPGRIRDPASSTPRAPISMAAR